METSLYPNVVRLQVSRALRNRCLEIFMEGKLGGTGMGLQ